MTPKKIAMELEMATLYLTEQNSLVKKDGDTLVVHLPEKEANGLRQGKRSVRVPLIKIERVVVQGNSTLTSPALGALMEQGAEVTFLNAYGRFQGHLTPAFSKNGQLRLAQTAARSNPERRHQVAQAFVLGKMANMRTILLRANRKREQPALEESAAAIRRLIDQTSRLPPDVEPPDPARPQAESAYGRLLGQEGNATAHYFQSFQHLLNDPSLFGGRTRRPPRDPVNALLSYGYIILLNQVTSAICTVGMDPYVGYLHGTQYGKPALALDLMEEFRPIIVDSVVLTLFNTGAIGRSDFTEEFGAYRLTDHGRRTFLGRLEARMDEQVVHPTFNYKADYRRCLELQTRLLAKTVLGEIESYPPFKVR